MGRKFTAAEQKRLDNDRLHPHIRRVIMLANTKTKFPFYVSECLRAKERQAELVADGKSQRMDGRHLTGHAADLPPFIDGKPAWPDDWRGVYEIADAMREAARELGVPLVWGACWTRVDNTTASMQSLVVDYKRRKKAQGKRPFLDGVHFELFEKVYPAAE